MVVIESTLLDLYFAYVYLFVHLVDLVLELFGLCLHDLDVHFLPVSTLFRRLPVFVLLVGVQIVIGLAFGLAEVLGMGRALSVDVLDLIDVFVLEGSALVFVLRYVARLLVGAGSVLVGSLRIGVKIPVHALHEIAWLELSSLHLIKLIVIILFFSVVGFFRLEPFSLSSCKYLVKKAMN